MHKFSLSNSANHFISVFFCSNRSPPPGRRKALLDNSVFGIIRTAGITSLVKRATSGLNADGSPATLNIHERKEITKQWLNHLHTSHLERGYTIDGWSLGTKDLKKAAQDVVACFPGEDKHYWFTERAYKVSLVSVVCNFQDHVLAVPHAPA